MPNQPQNKTFLRLLTDTQFAMARLFEHRARHLGLTRSQWRVITGLSGHDGVTQTELAEIVGMAKSPLGKIVDRLEAAGLVERRPDPVDRRAKRLFVTAELESLVVPAREVSISLEEAALERLNGNREQFVDMLERVHDSLHQIVEAELRSA